MASASPCISNHPEIVNGCHNGSQCVDLGAVSIATTGSGLGGGGSDLLDRFCDCQASKLLVAGIECEARATAICTRKEAEVSDQFCVNRGSCKALVEAGVSHPGCECPEGWEGDRCEYSRALLFDDAMDLFSQRRSQAEFGRSAQKELRDAYDTVEGMQESEHMDQVHGTEGFPLYAAIGAAGVVLVLVVLSAIRKVKLSKAAASDGDASVGYTTALSESTSKDSQKELMDDFSTGLDEQEPEETRNVSPAYVEELDEETSMLLETQLGSLGGCDNVVHEEESDPNEGEELQAKKLLQARITANKGGHPLCKTSFDVAAIDGLSYGVDADAGDKVANLDKIDINDEYV